MDQQGLAAAQPGLADDRIMRGDERLGHRAACSNDRPSGIFATRARG